MDEFTMSDVPEDEMDDSGASGPRIAASAEMEEALREATEAMEARRGAPVPVGSDGSSDHSSDDAHSPDKMTIELLSRELQDLKALYEDKVKECEEQEERYLRLHAEFDNFRRRGLKEKQESLQFGHQNLVKDLLSAVDNLERALEHGAQHAGAEVKGILDGVELVHREVLGALAKHGVTEIEAEGKVFDPAVHEAMGQVPNAEVPPNTILQVLQKGYLIRDRMLRPARVLVSREVPAAGAADPGSGGAT
jgi:molecular chaperone GrpE